MAVFLLNSLGFETATPLTYLSTALGVIHFTGKCHHVLSANRKYPKWMLLDTSQGTLKCFLPFVRQPAMNGEAWIWWQQMVTVNGSDTVLIANTINFFYIH